MYRFLFSLFIFSALCLQAQDPTPPAGLVEQELRDWLRNNWYLPWHDDLGYSPARIAMYGTIDNVGGQIECIYTGFTQAAEAVSFPNPINTEHTVPQSFFNSQTPMRSDIHHLFPSHGQANGDRGSLPFEEVVDNQADEWIISNGGYTSSSSVPNSNIDAYSEVHHNVAFEPREESKGNIARAVFYFYTMYADQVETQHSDISSVCDLDALYQWHQNDPPDAQEIERDERIQAEQGNYNPYVRMPQLAGPAWGFVSHLEEEEISLQWRLSENKIQILNPNVRAIQLIDMRGSLIAQDTQHSLSIDKLALGVYIMQVQFKNGQLARKKLGIQ